MKNILKKSKSESLDNVNCDISPPSKSGMPNPFNSDLPEEPDTPKKINNESENKMPIYLYSPKKMYENAEESKLAITSDFKQKTIIYMWFNKVTGKVYIGSAVDGSKRLSRYFQLSVLKKSKSKIYRNILKYGNSSFVVSILDVLGESGSVPKTDYLAIEQFYVDWAFESYGSELVLNILHKTDSSLGFKHSEESKKVIAKFRLGKKHTDATKQKLSDMFTGELGPFFGKSHTKETLSKMRASKLGEKNPMFGKTKSPEFILQQNKRLFGPDNPMFGKKLSESTLAKLSKFIYVYDINDNNKLLGIFSTVKCCREFKMCYNTLKKVLNDYNGIYKGRLFSRNSINS